MKKVFFREFVVGFITFDFKRSVAGILFLLLEIFSKKEVVEIDNE